MERKENLLDILKVLFQWKWSIFYICLGVGILAALLSLLLPNYYQSTTIFYAASMDQSKPERIFGTATSETDFYGNDRDNDRLLTIAESNELATYLIDKFDLYTHYDIDTTNEKAPFKVKQKFFKYYKALKTKRDAIELSMEDIDPEQAANIVNTAREEIDERYTKVIQGRLLDLKKFYEKDITSKEYELAKVSDSLIVVKNTFGIYDASSQGEVFAEQILSAASKLTRESAKLAALKNISNIKKDSINFLKAIVSGYKEELKILKQKQTLFNEGLSKVMILEQAQKELSNRLSAQKIRLNQLITANANPVSGINLIEAGTVPVIKSRPKRSILVLGAVLISFLACVLGVLLFDAYKDVDWKEIL